ncbi:MAG: ABC transporter permease [Firmicutes bacterium]|nr:ABC transporter permease [Bacillota bacterium]
MVRLAMKMLLRDRIRFGVTTLGVAAAVVLILALNGLFSGAARQITSYIDQSGADLFIAQQGVYNMHMATSVLPGDLAPRIETAPGVDQAVPMAFFATNIEVEGTRHLVYLIALPPEAPFGGAWKVSAGKGLAAPGEVILARDLADKHDLALGSRILVQGRSLRVTGLAEELSSMASSFAFISLGDAQAIRGSGPTAAYYLVRIAAGADPSGVAESIRLKIPEVNPMTTAELSMSDREIGLQMGVDVLRAMAVAGFLVGLAVVGLSVYTTVVEQLRQFGILKAVGAGRGHLLHCFLLQSQVMALAGFAVGVVLTWILRLAVPYLVLGMELDLEPAYLLLTLGEVLVIGALAAVPPWLRVSRLDPMVVFRS